MPSLKAMKKPRHAVEDQAQPAKVPKDRPLLTFVLSPSVGGSALRFLSDHRSPHIRERPKIYRGSILPSNSAHTLRPKSRACTRTKLDTPFCCSQRNGENTRQSMLTFA